MKTRLMTAALASLLVAGFAAVPSFAEETAGQKVDDVTVLTRIKADLLQSKNVDGLDVNVDVKDGRVTLSGTASTDAPGVSIGFGPGAASGSGSVSR